MPRPNASRRRCAIYTRKSSEEGLDQDFNSLAAQREACEAFIRSQRNEGWVLVRTRYDDGGFSGGSVERPALQGLLADIRAGRIDIVVVYKVDRLTRSLADFARLVELFDAEAVSFVSVTQQFNTTSSMGRLTLNVPYTIDFIAIIFHPKEARRPICVSRQHLGGGLSMPRLPGCPW
jgi:DNA invertase Pin-like site-specific DNA recombinase